jgi:hypothetical protein
LRCPDRFATAPITFSLREGASREERVRFRQGHARCRKYRQRRSWRRRRRPWRQGRFRHRDRAVCASAQRHAVHNAVEGRSVQCSVFSRASGAEPPDGTSHEKRFSIFVASFVGSFVDEARDKARDKVSQIRDQNTRGGSGASRSRPGSLTGQAWQRRTAVRSGAEERRGACKTL